jgi:hypothetical protein
MDEHGRRFVIVPLGPQTRVLEGRPIEISIDGAGRLTVRPLRRLQRGDE